MVTTIAEYRSGRLSSPASERPPEPVMLMLAGALSTKSAIFVSVSDSVCSGLWIVGLHKGGYVSFVNIDAVQKAGLVLLVPLGRGEVESIRV